MIKRVRQHLTETSMRIDSAAGLLPDTDETATEQYTPEQVLILKDKLAQAERLIDEVRATLFRCEK